MNNWKAVSCAIAAGLMIFTTTAPAVMAEDNIQVESTVRAQQIQEYQKQISDVKKEIEKYEQDRIENEQKKAETQKNLTETQQLIVQKNEEIAALEKKIEQREYVIKNRLVALQSQQRSNMVTDVIVDAESLSDLLDRISSVSLIFQSDKDILEAQQRDEDAVKAAQELVVQKQKELTEVAASLDKVSAEIEAARQAKQGAVDELEGKIQQLVQEDLDEKARKELEEAAMFAQRMANETSITTDEQAAPTQEAAAPAQEAAAPAQTAAAKPAQEAAKPAQTAPAQTAPAKPAPAKPAPAPAPTSGGVVAKAQQYLGVPYVFGGASPSGFDCSGFISYVYGKARTDVSGYWNSVSRISRDQLQPGDLIFFQNTYKPGPSHIGIYVGNNTMIHAGDSGIAYSNLSSSYNQSHLLGYGRF
ncbi:C40 family peptidase [Ectobacillus funiculus]|uniref:C40 family peptidase n=1 Tax=Ectobacillus funiculus TaxID=137993 RepID=UPI00101D9297|nr:C40 family peptidase [Ectobacillus funiculus]